MKCLIQLQTLLVDYCLSTYDIVFFSMAVLQRLSAENGI